MTPLAVYSLRSIRSSSKECFLTWIRTIVKIVNDEVIAVDGKTARYSFDRTNGKSAMNVVNAWASESRMPAGPITTTTDRSTKIMAVLRPGNTGLFLIWIG